MATRDPSGEGHRSESMKPNGHSNQRSSLVGMRNAPTAGHEISGENPQSRRYQTSALMHNAGDCFDMESIYQEQPRSHFLRASRATLPDLAPATDIPVSVRLSGPELAAPLLLMKLPKQPDQHDNAFQGSVALPDTPTGESRFQGSHGKPVTWRGTATEPNADGRSRAGGIKKSDGFFRRTLQPLASKSTDRADLSYSDHILTKPISKRNCHSAAERCRRNRMRNALQEVAKLLPRATCPSGANGAGGSSSGGNQTTKASTVEMAVEYIKSLQQEVAEMKIRLEEWRLPQMSQEQADQPALSVALT